MGCAKYDAITVVKIFRGRGPETLVRHSHGTTSAVRHMRNVPLTAARYAQQRR